MGYPTWQVVSEDRVESEEGQWAGSNTFRVFIADFIIERTGPNQWYLKRRTSALWAGPFHTAEEAKVTLADDLAYSARDRARTGL
jgi:hypothetical protein